MQISNINLGNYIRNDIDLFKLRIGQRLQVEVINIDENQEGFVSIGDKIIRAKVEAQVQNGERFWVSVKEANDNEIVLSRDSLNNTKINKEQLIILMNRGFNVDKEISDYLVKFANNNLSTILFLIKMKNPQLNQLTSLLLKIIPKWSEINKSNTNIILEYYKGLGIDLEKTLYESYFQEHKDISINSLSIKIQLLKVLSDNNSISDNDKAILNQLLEEITGQQLWFQSGVKKDAYYLLHFPLQDNELFYNCKMAIESNRKGQKIDMEHCHIALQVETKYLGIIGADLMIYEDSISISIINNNIEELTPLIQNLYDETENSFASLGLKLKNISLKTHEDFPQFSKFISGNQICGVDLKG